MLKFRQILSIILVFIMVFSSFPINTLSAAEEKKPDFSSKQLMVELKDKEEKKDTGEILGNINNVYLLQYASEEETQNAYEYFKTQNIPVEINENSHEKPLDYFEENHIEKQKKTEENTEEKQKDANSDKKESSEIKEDTTENNTKEEPTEESTEKKEKEEATQEREEFVLLSVPYCCGAHSYMEFKDTINKNPKTIRIPYTVDNCFIDSLIHESIDKGIEIICPKDFKKIDGVVYSEEPGKETTEEEMTEKGTTEEKADEISETPKEQATTEKQASIKKSSKKAPPLRASGSGEYTVTYDANGGFFNDPGNETNDVVYKWGNIYDIKYSHTFNVNDDGIQQGVYNHSMNTHGEVFSFPEASKIKAVITYGGESAAYDWVCMWAGSHPNYNASSNYSSSVTGKLGGGNHTNANNTKTYMVDGNAVTFSFRSDGSGLGDGYGYYAVLTACDSSGNPISLGDGNEKQSGTYLVPRKPGKVLEGWYADPECTQPFDVLHTQLTEDTRVYAKYSDDDWYNNYTYTLNEETHEIVLTRYNGNEYNVVLPAKTMINGVEYTTVVNGPVYQGKNLGSIVFDNGVKSGTNLKNLFSGCAFLTKIHFQDFDTSKATDMSNMFNGCTKLTTVDVSGLDTSNVTDMNNMFYNCNSLTSLDVSHFNTSNVTHMGGMFYNCNKLTSLDFSDWDTGNVKNMANMFNGCSSLTSLDVSHFNTGNVENMASMFSNCSKLTSLDVSNFDTGKVTNMASMFSSSSRLTSLDVSHFNTSNVTNMTSMFSNCSGLTSLNVSGLDTSNVTAMNSMFYNCSRLTSLDVSDFNTGKVTNMASMFSGCSTLPVLDVSNFDTKNVTSMDSMFYNCRNLSSLDVSHFDTGKVTSMANMFRACYKLPALDLSAWDTKSATNMSYMFYDCNTLTDLDIRNLNTAKVTNMEYMFGNCTKLPTLDLSNFNTGKVTNMQYMFYNCNALTPIDVSSFNTSNVTNMSHLFAGCSSITELDLSNFNTAKVTTMNGMFSGDKNLTDLNISSFNTSNVLDMANMFNNCSQLPELDVTHFNTNKVTNMSSMFNGCSSLPEIDVSHFNTANVTGMSSMFAGCSNIKDYDLSNFNTAKVTSMSSMFSNNTSLENLDLSNFNTANVTSMSGMFYGDKNLETLNIDNFNTGKVNNMSNMFYDCKKLEEIDVSHFNTANVTNMASMFSGCKSVKELDVSNFATNKVQDTTYMFSRCDSLDEIDVSNFNLNAIRSTNTYYMFNSTSLKKITVGPNFKFKSDSTFPTGNWYKGDTDEKYSNRELYQQYNSSMADTYNKELVVTFNPVGGRVDTKTHFVTYDKEIEQLPNATKIGYQFVGWFTEKTGGEEIHVGDHYKQPMYYAHWTPNHYTLRLNPNGGQGDVKNIPLAYDESCQLNATIFQRPGWEIYEWNTKQDGSGKSYAPDDEITMLTSGDGDIVTLYAQWSNDWVDITFDSAGGAEVPPKHLVRGKKLGPLYEPAKEGYQFMGWYTEPNGQGTKITSETIPNGNTVYYAFWQKDPVISFNDGTSVTKKTVPYGKEINLLPEPHKANYVFDAWYTEPNGQGEKITKNKIITQDATFYANWLLKPIFDPDGGIITQAEDESNYGEKDPEHFVLDSFPIASKPGYDFLGWYTKDGRKLEIGDEINLYEGSTIYAHWQGHETIQVTYDGNGASNPNPIKLYKNQPIGPLPFLSRPNKKFLGWELEDGTPVTEQSAFSEDVTLHAKWENLIPVTFDSNGGSNVATRNIQQGSTFNTIPGSRRANYVLEGWYDKDGNKLTEDTVITKPVTYTARWLPEVHEGADEAINYVYAASWANASNENVDNVDNNLEFHPTDTSNQTAQLHVRFELNRSVDNTLPVGSVNIKIPKYVFENWDGQPIGTNNLSYNLPKYPDTRNGMYFSYIEEDDHYILTNNVELPGGAGVDLTVHYTVDPRQVKGGAMDYNNEYIDGYPYLDKTFPITFTVDRDMNGTIDVDKEIDLDIEMHTRVRTSQQKTYSGIYYKWNEGWGPKPSDADNYFYISWGLNENYLSTTNQPSTYRWTEDTVHDGTVVKLTNGGVITKHPNSLLQDLNENGLVIYNEAVVTEDWKSGYSTPHRVSAQAIIRDRHYPTGEFTKLATSNHLINGGQEEIVDEEHEISMPYALIYDGSSYNLDTMPVPDGDSYTKKPRTITFEDGVHGDILYNSGSPANKYTWGPDTGNVVLGDSDYYFKNISISLQEYDSSYRNGEWTKPIAATDTTQYDNVEIWVRLANQTEFIKYKTILGTNNSTIPLPERTVGFKVVHPTKYYSTKLRTDATLVLKPTQKVMALIQNDMAEKTTSVIKNIARCDITDTQDESFFSVTNRTSDENSAYKELYELNISNTKMNVRKDSANTSAVVIDVNRGTQDNPMVINAWNYNNAGRRKTLNNVVFYDLLPMGTTVDEDSIYGVYTTSNYSSWTPYASSYNKNSANINRNYYNVQFVEDWEGSKKTMMIITTNLPKNIKNTGIAFHYMLHNTYENIVENGTVLENDVACANIAEGHVPPDSISNTRSVLAYKDYYLNLERQYEGDIGFAQASTHYMPIDAFSWGFFKTVKTDTDYVPESEVYRNSEYTYRLTYSQSDYAKSDRLIFFDVLEGGTDTKTSQWHGTFESVNTESASQKKGHNSNSTCNPVVYYSTKPRNEFTGYDFYVENTETWSTEMPANKADVTAVAIDCRKNKDGTDFVMMGKQAINVYVTMKSPAQADLVGLTTTNGAVSSARKYTNGVPEDESTKEEADCSVTIKDFYPEVHKTSTPETGTELEPKRIDLGETVNYNISVKNKDTTSILYDVVVEDPIPDNMIVNTNDILVYTDNPNHTTSVKDSTRISFTRNGQNLRFTIKELIPNETMHFIIPAISDGNHVIYENQAGVITVNGVEKEVESEITYHRTNFWPINVSKKISGTNNFLPGATLKLATTGGETLKTWTSQEGAEICNLRPGDYILTEESVPDGYVKSEPITIHVPEDGAITTNPANALNGNNLTMFDAERKSLTLTKHSSGNYMDVNDTFDFILDLKGLENGRTYPVTATEGVLLDGQTMPQSITGTVEGSTCQKVMKITMKAGQQFKVDGLPANATYQVTEKANSYKPSYTINAGNNGVVASAQGNNPLSGIDLATQVETLDIQDSDTVVAFENVRNMKHGQTQIAVKKTLSGETLQANQFEFKLYDSQGNLIETKNNTATGDVTFSPITYDISAISKDIIYTIRETEGNRTDMVYDKTVAYAKVEVLDSPTDELETRITYFTEPPTASSTGESNFTFKNHKTYELTLKKADAENNPLSGATLQLLREDGSVYEEWSDASHIAKIIVGKYKFHEVKAPTGYDKAEDIPIEVKNDGTILINGTPANEVTMVDPAKTGSVTIHKKDWNGEDLSGVVFAIYDKNGNELASKTTDSHGNLTFDNIASGKYKIIEKTTREGRTLLSDPINVQIPLVVSEASAANLDTTKAEYDNGNYYFYNLNYEVQNFTSLHLPKTGGIPVFYLGIFGFLFIYFGLFFRKKKLL